MWRQNQSLFLILSVIITGSLSGRWDMVVSPEVRVSRGEDAVLSCSFTHPHQQQYSGMITVKWLARDSKAEPFFSCAVKNDSMERPSGCSFPGLKYSLDGDPRRGELSLLIRKVELTDNGKCFCRVELDRQRSYLQKETELHVTAEPQILSLSVVETPPDSDSAPRRLQCEAEGSPLPQIVWLSASRKLTDDQGKTFQSGPYRRIASVPYLQEEVLTCRAESSEGEAERTYPSPAADTLMMTLTVCGLLLLLLLLISTGVIVCCLRNRARTEASSVYENADSVENRRQRASASAADGDGDFPLVYSAVTMTSSAASPSAVSMNSTQKHEEPGAVYSLVLP